MTPLTVPNLEEDVRDKLEELARSHGRSVEEEARDILRDAVLSAKPPAPVQGLGSRIAARFAGIGHDEGFDELRASLTQV